MDAVTAEAWIRIIVAIGGILITLVTLLKVQGVHKIVNSAMTQEKTENAMLRGLLTVKQLEIDSAERARVALATAASMVSVPPTIPVPVVASTTIPSTDPVPKVIVP